METKVRSFNVDRRKQEKERGIQKKDSNVKFNRIFKFYKVVTKFCIWIDILPNFILLFSVEIITIINWKLSFREGIYKRKRTS